MFASAGEICGHVEQQINHRAWDASQEIKSMLLGGENHSNVSPCPLLGMPMS